MFVFVVLHADEVYLNRTSQMLWKEPIVTEMRKSLCVAGFTNKKKIEVRIHITRSENESRFSHKSKFTNIFTKMTEDAKAMASLVKPRV